jgi:hypothetical protein
MFFGGGFGILASGIRNIRNRPGRYFKLFPTIERQEIVNVPCPPGALGPLDTDVDENP